MDSKSVEGKDNEYLKTGKSSFRPAVSPAPAGRLLIRTSVTGCHLTCARTRPVAESSPSCVIFHSTFEQLSYKCLPYNELRYGFLYHLSPTLFLCFLFWILHVLQRI